MTCLSGAFFAILHVFLASVASGARNEDLVNSLIQDYDQRTIPVPLPGDDKVIIRISVALRMVVELNAKQQVLTTSVWIRERWYDQRLAWNRSEHENVEKVIIPQQEIWKPDLILYDNTDFDYSGAVRNVFATVWHNGTILLVYPALFKSACSINIYFFPFDQQICEIRFSSWTYDSSNLIFELDPKRASDTSYYKFNSEWLLTNFSASTNEEYMHDCCEAPMQDVTFAVTLRRRSIMLFYYLYFPNILINIIATFQFLLPCDSTEKVTLGITILLAMIVYLLLMEEMLPQTEVVPIIVHYMSVTLGLVTASLLITILVLEVHHNGKHDNHSQLPQWARRYLLHGLARILRMDKYITSDSEREHLLNPQTSRMSVYEDQIHIHGAHTQKHHDEAEHQPQPQPDHHDPDNHPNHEPNDNCGPPSTDPPPSPPPPPPPPPIPLSFTHSRDTPDPMSHPVPEPKPMYPLKRRHTVDVMDDTNQNTDNQNVSNANQTANENAVITRQNVSCQPAPKSMKKFPLLRQNTVDVMDDTNTFNPNTVNQNTSNASQAANQNSVITRRNVNWNANASRTSNVSSLFGTSSVPNHRAHSASEVNSMQDSGKYSLVLKRSELTSSRDLLLLKILHYCEDFAERATIEDREQELSCEWQQLAMLLDRLVFYIYIIITMMVWIIILGSRPIYQDDGIR